MELRPRKANGKEVCANGTSSSSHQRHSTADSSPPSSTSNKKNGITNGKPIAADSKKRVVNGSVGATTTTIINPHTHSTSKDAAAPPRRAPIFVYPPLPEIKLCFLITIGAIAYGWWCVWAASQRYSFRIGQRASYHELPFGLGKRIKDESNWEWSRWSPFALYHYLPALLIHSAVFNLPPLLLRGRLSELHHSLLCVAVWSATAVWVFTWQLIAASLAQGILLFTATLWIRHKATVWVAAAPILYVMMNHAHLLVDDVFLVLLYSSYTLLSQISFCLDWVDGKARAEDSHSPVRLFIRMLFYSLYQPYQISLIVLYGDFERQIAERNRSGLGSGKRQNKRNWWGIAWCALRVVGWWALIELGLHYFYFETMLGDESWAARLRKDEFVSMGMVMGAFFHLKYVVIFGLPALFARIDNMQPMAGPICLSRVALYSKIWRSFDRGLYAFFKQYLFLPICRPSFSAGRKLLGVLISYLFVLVWHGFHHHNVVWIALNIAELLFEYGAKGVYSTCSALRDWREAHVSDVNFRRVLAVLQIVCFAFGLYSNFYFLGGSRVGELFVERIFWEETVPVRWPFLLLITLGYFYMHVAMEVDSWEGAAKPLEGELEAEGNKSKGNGGVCPFGRKAQGSSLLLRGKEENGKVGEHAANGSAKKKM